MIFVDDVKIGGKHYTYLKVEMKSAPLVMIKGENGFVMCGYLNMQAAEKLNDCAVRVTGVSDLESLLDARVVELTSAAKDLGISEGQRIAEILHNL